MLVQFDHRIYLKPTFRLHKEIKTLPLSNHINLHASQLRQKAQLPTHPLHNLTQQLNCLRKKKQTIFHNWGGKTIYLSNNNSIPPTPESISQNLKTMHTIAVSECLMSYKPNPILSQLAPDINQSEQSLPRKTRRILAQLCTGKSPILMAYLNAIDPKSYPSPSCPLCKSHDHTTQHLFSCSSIYTTLTPRDLWDKTVGTAALLQQCADAMQVAGGGSGGSTA